MSSINTLGKNEVGSDSVLAIEHCQADVEAMLTQWWQELLGIEGISLDADFFDLGGHSLIAVQLVSTIKTTYGVEFGLSMLFDARTIRQLAEQIRAAMKQSSPEPARWSPLVPIQPQGSRRPLFWLPGGEGTSILQFKEISLLLGPDQPVYGFEARMSEAHEELESVEEKAAHFIREMRLLQPQGPYSLVGFCGGGYIAYEMAQQLHADGQEVAFLGMVECAHPHYPGGWLGKTRFGLERGAWRVGHFLARGPFGIAHWAAERSKSLAQWISLRADRAKARLFRKPVPPLPGRPVDINAKAWRAALRYQPVEFPGKCVVLVGKDSWDFQGVSSALDPRLAWCTLSKGGSYSKALKGSHLDLLEAPLVSALAAELKKHLEPCPAPRS